MRWILLLAFTLGTAACAPKGTGQNPDPIPRIEFERTTRLLELRDALDIKNQAYVVRTGDKFNANTNKRQLAKLEDEYANWDRRAQAQIERELVRRYQGGETRAYFRGIEAQVPGAVPPAPVEGAARP